MPPLPQQTIVAGGASKVVSDDDNPLQKALLPKTWRQRIYALELALAAVQYGESEKNP